jgi:hypothetical protein
MILETFEVDFLVKETYFYEKMILYKIWPKVFRVEESESIGSFFEIV